MITTFLTEEEVNKFKSSTDKEINDLLVEVNHYFDKFLVQEKDYTIKRFFFKTEKRKLYTLYSLLNRAGEVQIINFCQDWNWSINTDVPKSYIVTYFLGILSGIDEMERRKK
jgi:hypothetical protein